jgi:cytidine deaminase
MSAARKTKKRGDEAVERLVTAARGARERAYAPYSKYKVGAAILTKSGSVFAGANVENAAYPAGMCAERSAIAQMIAAGEREPVACAVATGGPRAGSPCGFCRQVLREFARDMRIVLVAEEAGRLSRRETTLARLLPDAFDGSALKKRPSPRRG